MKKALCTLLCLAVCAALAACGAQPQSGAAPALPAASSSAAAGTASSSAPASGAQSGASLPAGSSGAASAPSSSRAPGRAQRVTATLADGSGSVALALPVPESWQLDGYTTWMEDGRKVLELGSVWKLPVYSDTAAPFTKEMTDPFLNNEMGYPEGYGLQRTLDFMLDGRHAKMILYKTWPDDSDKPWYPHYLFYVVPDGAGDGYYVVRLDFFSFEESAGDDTLFAIAQGMTATAA